VKTAKSVLRAHGFCGFLFSREDRCLAITDGNVGPGSPLNADPDIAKENQMKKDIHPEYKETQVTCGCGEKFVTRSTVASGSIYVEVCSVCHPFYTGKQRILDTGGRVAKFEERFGKKTAN
jgi:large subunit ribosomal protein L31